MHSHLRPTACLILAAQSLLCAGCHLIAPENKHSSKNRLIEREGILFERDASITSARISFRTKRPAICEIVFTDQSADGSKPTTHPCSQNHEQMHFVETIQPLKTDRIYGAEIRAWEIGQNPEHADKHTVFEKGEEGLGRDLVFVRLAAPLHVAELHRYISSEAIAVQDIDAHIRPEIGCKEGPPQMTNEFGEASDLRINNVRTRGFASGTGNRRENSGERISLDFNTYNDTEAWEWTFSDGVSEHSFAANQAPLLLSTIVRGVESHELAAGAKGIDVDQRQGIELNWTTTSLAKDAYIMLQVGTAGQQGQFFCQFNAADGRARLGAGSHIDQLARGESYEITISLIANQLHLFPSQGGPVWIISSQDWRTSDIRMI